MAAEVLGYQTFDPRVRLAGVILNGVAGPGHLDFCKPQVEETTGLPVLGYLPRRDDLCQPERHLGLVPTVEGTVAREWYRRLIDQVEDTVDLDRVVRLASTSRPPAAGASVYPETPHETRTVMSVAMDRAFSFYYQDSLDLLDLLDLLEAWGAELRPFSPLEDEALPEDVGGVYIGGGFPEMYARELAENRAMGESLRRAAAREVPIYGECGGLMYLGRSLTDFEGVEHPMAGLIPVSSSMPGSRLSLGYRQVEALADGPILALGQRSRGHEFHWSVQAEEATQELAAYRVLDQGGRLEGFRSGSVWASYVHLHLGSHPSLAPRFVDTCAQAFRQPGALEGSP